MNAAARIGIAALPFAVAVVVAWHDMNAHLGQAAPFMGPSVFGLLLGLYMTAMASVPLVVGGVLSAACAHAMRLRPPAFVGDVADRWLSILAPLGFFAALFVAWRLMWQLDPPMPTRDAPYGTSYFALAAFLGLAWSVLFGGAAWFLVVREVAPARPAAP